jgi:hypothetical protein
LNIKNILLIVITEFYLSCLLKGRINTIKTVDPVSPPQTTYVAASACYGDHDSSGYCESGGHDADGCDGCDISND